MTLIVASGEPVGEGRGRRGGFVGLGVGGAGGGSVFRRTDPSRLWRDRRFLLELPPPPPPGGSGGSSDLNPWRLPTPPSRQNFTPPSCSGTFKDLSARRHKLP